MSYFKKNYAKTNLLNYSNANPIRQFFILFFYFLEKWQEHNLLTNTEGIVSVRAEKYFLPPLTDNTRNNENVKQTKFV